MIWHDVKLSSQNHYLRSGKYASLHFFQELGGLTMLWLKAFHIIAVVCWFSGLFYLPRLFVYHVQAKDAISIERFKVMEWRLLYCITTPAALFTLLFGISMLTTPAGSFFLKQGWLHIKFTLVFLLVIYHILCMRYASNFKRDRNTHSEKFYRFFNEIPSVLLIAIVIVTVVKPMTH
jgi:putative membrane protein